ncbi:MAG: hypothetical protein DBY30_03870 [Verrucomicrobia bacterium]|nr:MAG: hypothetical protein DBY30_03870 [Verrucomicrobiota bacterium]
MAFSAVCPTPAGKICGGGFCLESAKACLRAPAEGFRGKFNYLMKYSPFFLADSWESAVASF